MKAQFKLMAIYNRWMNKKIYSSAAQLSVEELERDRAAFFGSIIATLNHIAVGDIIWLKRFATFSERYNSLDLICAMSKPESLNAVLHQDLEGLTKARAMLDEAIIGFVNEMIEQDIVSLLAYTDTKGHPYIKNFGHLLQHFFNHQTHHRGQVTVMLSQSGIDVGETDLLACIPNE